MTRHPLPALFLILLLWLIGLGAAAQFAKIAIPFAAMRQAYPEAGGAIGWALTLISLIGAVLGMTAGSMVARFGCVRVLRLAVLLAGLLSLWQSLLPEFGPLLMSRVIEGAAHLFIVVAAPTLIAEISPDKWRGAAMTLWSSFFGVAFALAAWLLPSFVATQGLAAVFQAHGLFMLSAGALFILTTLRETAGAPDTSIGFSPRQVVQMHIEAFSSPTKAPPAIGWLFYTLSYVSLLTLLPELLPDAKRSQIATLMPLASTVVSLGLVPLLLLRSSAVSITVVGFGLSALAVAGIFLGLPMGIIAITAFATLGLVQSGSFACVPELNHNLKDRAQANGAMAQMGNTGNLLGTPILMYLLGVTGMQATFATIVLLYLSAAAAHLLFAHRRRKLT